MLPVIIWNVSVCPSQPLPKSARFPANAEHLSEFMPDPIPVELVCPVPPQINRSCGKDIPAYPVEQFFRKTEGIRELFNNRVCISVVLIVMSYAIFYEKHDTDAGLF